MPHDSAAGVVVGVDPGAVRTGVAATDPHQLLASPVATLEAAEAVSGVVALAIEREAVAVVVGLPLSLSGAEGTAAVTARSYAESLVQRLRQAAEATAPVYLVDERLTTVSAASALKAAGHDTRSARRVVDQAAAAALLQGVVDAARGRGVGCLEALQQGLGMLVDHQVDGDE